MFRAFFIYDELGKFRNEDRLADMAMGLNPAPLFEDPDPALERLGVGCQKASFLWGVGVRQE